MTRNDIQELMTHFDASGLTYLEVETGDGRVKMKKAAVGGAISSPGLSAGAAMMPETAPAPVKTEAGTVVRAPLVGVFYAAPAPGESPFVQVGQTVKRGDILCLVEAMKMLNEIPAPAGGVIEEVLAQDGALVGFDAPLFRLREC